MNWFYLLDQKQIGPLSESTLKELHACGALDDNTPVRTEDSDCWEPFLHALGKSIGTPSEPEPAEINDPIFKFDCPHCQQSISASPDYAGQTVTCPTCNQGFVVPTHNLRSLTPTNKVDEGQLTAIEAPSLPPPLPHQANLRVGMSTPQQRQINISGNKKTDLTRNPNKLKLVVMVSLVVLFFGATELLVGSYGSVFDG